MDTAASPGLAGMPTPPASSVAPSSHASPLPQPRRHPLKPGGPRESELIRYLDYGLNNVHKRVDNRLQKEHGAVGVLEGYHHFGEVVKDVEGLVDVIWVSGSPNLQIPYLLNIARSITEYIPLFPSSPRHMFRLLDKLDFSFSSLLLGRDFDTNEPLPGFESGRSMSTTDKVRLKGIVDRARPIVVRRMRGGGAVDEEGDGEPMDTEDESMVDAADALLGVQDNMVKFEGFDDDDDEDGDEEAWNEVQMTRVYEKTIGELGDVLGGPPIGIITDD